MHILRCNNILIPPNRQRREFDKAALAKMADSIKRNGLLHPIVVESCENPVLRCGERRLRVLSTLINEPYKHNGVDIPAGSVPVTTTGELSELQRREVEFEENVIRTDLTWNEKNKAIAEMHALRSEQAAERGEKQTYTATALEIKGSSVVAPDIMGVRHATILAPFLDDPDVAKAATEREALSVVRRKLTQIFNERLAENFDVSKAETPHTLLKGDCLDLLPSLPDGYFDCIIADPPYGIGAHKMQPMSRSESGSVHEYEDSYNDAIVIWRAIFHEGARVCKPTAHIYMFCDFRHWYSVRELAKDSGWTVWPTPIIWYKPSGGMLGDSTRGPRKSYETILFASRGDKRVTGVYFDVIVENPADSVLHAASKPVPVYTNLLRRSCVPGDKVLDPCAGSGTVFPAANRLRCVATGIELASTHYSIALQRLHEQ